VKGLQINTVTEDTQRTCSYTVQAQSKFACGAEVKKSNPTQKSGGKVAGAFFGGVFAMAIVGALGFYLYTRNQMGLPLLPFDGAPMGTGAAGAGSSSSAGAASSDASFTGAADSGSGSKDGTYSSL